MATHNSHQLSKHKRLKSQWTFLIVNERGESRKLAHFRAWLKFFIILFIILIFAAAALGFWLHKSWDVQRSLTKKLQDRESALKVLSKKKDILLSRVLRAESRLLELKNQLVRNNSYQNANANTNAKPVKNEAKPEISAAPKTAAPTPNPRVTGDSFKWTHVSSRGQYTASFKVRNSGSRKKPVAGYIFVILKHLKSNPNDWISLPEAALNSGKPVDYKKGAYFSAVNYKVFKMRIADHRIPSHFNVAALLIYDPDGRLVFEKNMAIVLSSDNITSKSSRKPESRKVGDQEPNHKKPGSASPSSSDLGRTNAHAHQSLEKKVPLQSASKGKKNEPIPDMAKTLTPEWPSSHPFSIHVFSYQHQQQAQHRVQELEKKGYDSFFIPVNIPNKGQFYRIFIGQYKSAQAAGITLKEIKSKPEFEKDIHIMSRQQALAK